MRIFICFVISMVIIDFGLLSWAVEKRLSAGEGCKAGCRDREGIICLERGPCEPINEFLLEAARRCREEASSKFLPVNKLIFVDILSSILRLDREFPKDIQNLSENERYLLKVNLLKEKGIGIFSGTNPLSPLTREELVGILKKAVVERHLGLSTGLPNQIFDLKNERFLIYDVELYVDEGKGFELWNRKDNFSTSLPISKDYVVKITSCEDGIIMLGDNERGKIPPAGSKLKVAYKYYGKEEEVVTECEIAMLLSNHEVAKALKDAYNPARPLTKANFVDLLIRAMHLDRNLPRDYSALGIKELYKLQTGLLARNGIGIFIGSDPDGLLTHEELARVLYDSPVEEIVGFSNGKPNQEFKLDNAGFIIYDLHVYIKEGETYEEWTRRESFIDSSYLSKDYLIKLDSGNYASIYFGDNIKGKIPPSGSAVKAKYRLYAPVTMVSEDDILCILGKRVPVVETYEPPPGPPDFPPPADGFEEPATHI